jgi:hypothetical protein
MIALPDFLLAHPDDHAATLTVDRDYELHCLATLISTSLWQSTTSISSGCKSTSCAA